MIKVYHNKKFIDYTFVEDQAEIQTLLDAQVPQDFSLVAKVKDPGGDIDEMLENIYRLTNHIDCDWTRAHAFDFVKLKSRSSSVGDIFSVSGRTIEPKYYIVSTFGFTEVNLAHAFVDLIDLPMAVSQ